MRTLCFVLAITFLCIGCSTPEPAGPTSSNKEEPVGFPRPTAKEPITDKLLEAKTAFDKDPSAINKKAYAAELAKDGTTKMTDANALPKDKYRNALKLYKQALELDPQNEEALNNKALIESIYKQMGKPIPNE